MSAGQIAIARQCAGSYLDVVQDLKAKRLREGRGRVDRAVRLARLRLGG